MHGKFEVASFLKGVLDSRRDGRIHIADKGVNWCLDISNGEVLFAAHSLQYLATLETVLPELGYESALSIYWRLIRSEAYGWKQDAPAVEQLSWTSRIVGGLVRYEALRVEQATKTLVTLTKDAVDSLLGLESADVVWHSLPQGAWHINTRGISIKALLRFLSERQQAWQPVCDRIISPHQRPYCEIPEDLYQPISQGRLPQEMLTSLARLMQGASIRQLAQTIKQDEAKLAELLYPYICHRVIRLWPPVQPFDRLPWLPTQSPVTAEKSPVTVVSASTSDHTGNPMVSSGTQVQPKPASRLLVANNSTAIAGDQSPSDNNSIVQRPASPALPVAASPASHSRYLIICIDDSQAMLEQIDSYLDPDRFELKTIIDPVASVSKICTMKPDLVLMDVSMPSINGNSLCQILKRSYMFKHVPIIMISSNASPLNKATAESAGATDYLEKPFSKAQLMKVLETYLETKVSSELSV